MPKHQNSYLIKYSHFHPAYQKKHLNRLRLKCLFFKWWFLPELNRGHKDFQSFALPTELRNHLVAGEGFEPTASGL